MTEISTFEIKDFLNKRQGLEVTLAGIRREFNILSGSKSFDAVRNIMLQLSEQKIVRQSGKKDGVWKVVRQVSPVPVFSVERERRPAFGLIFPRDFNTMMEMSFAGDVIIREGDLILLAGMSNYGKTTLCLNFCGENIDKQPVLMGNEYTSLIEQEVNKKIEEYEPSPRFLDRVDVMNVNNGGWVNWIDVDGNDKFVLLPVREDYAEHIVKNKINIIDWINLPGEYYMISPLMESIKRSLGRGIGILAIQKNEGLSHGIGGDRTKEFADLELLLDRFGDNDVLLTIGKVKEPTKPITGKTFAYSIIGKGTKIVNFREVKKCPHCKGLGYIKGIKCDFCFGHKFIDTEGDLPF